MQVFDNDKVYDVAGALKGDNPDWELELCTFEAYRLVFDALDKAVNGATDKDIAQVIWGGGTFGGMRIALEELVSQGPNP